MPRTGTVPLGKVARFGLGAVVVASGTRAVATGITAKVCKELGASRPRTCKVLLAQATLATLEARTLRLP